MKIAFIGQKGLPAAGAGMEKHVEEIAVRMSGQGHEVFAYATKGHTKRELVMHRGVRLIHLPSFGLQFLDAMVGNFFATVHVMFSDYDIVHYHGAATAQFSWMVKVFSLKTKVILSVHSQKNENQNFASITLSSAHKIIATDKELALKLQQENLLESTFIPNGREISHPASYSFVHRLNLRNQKYILTTGQLVKENRLHFLIETFKQLEDTAKTTNNFKLVILSQGKVDDDYVRYLQTISQGRETIVFLEDENGKFAQQLFPHAFMFIALTESKQLKENILHAMSCGLAPLVSDEKENLEIIGEGGFSFEGSSMQDLQQRLAYLLSRPEEVKKIGEMARKKIEEEYGWETIAEKTLEVYEQIIFEINEKQHDYNAFRIK